MRLHELSTQVALRLTPEQLRALRANSKANERTLSQTVRLACEHFLATQGGTA